MAASVPSGVTWGQMSGCNAGVYAHYCALKSDGIASCWGADYSGQVTGLPSSAVSMAYIMPSLLTVSQSSTAGGTTTGATTTAIAGVTTTATTAATTSATTGGTTT